MTAIQSIRGVKDILPDETPAWQEVEAAWGGVCARYNYREIRIPVLERTALFARTIGEETDIVRKEMYSFTDGGGDDLSLRPEGTAGVVRAYIQHAMGAAEAVAKLCYLGPMFRRERPQKGRYRQFHQAGAELFGARAPLGEIEQVLMLRDFFGAAGIERVAFSCNHLGTPASRGRYVEELAAWLGGREESLCEDCARRLRTNTLRVLDCKQEGCRALLAGAPRFDGFVPDEQRRELDRFLGALAARGVDVRADDGLVRGLDYYTGIVFEGAALLPGRDGPPLALVGGGRYDNLVEQLGGGPTPAVGYAVGLERVVELCGARAARGVDLFVAALGEAAAAPAMELLDRVRRAGWRADFDPRGGSLKSQLKRADRLGARLAAVIGENEVNAGTIVLRDMRASAQREARADEIEEALRAGASGAAQR